MSPELPFSIMGVVNVTPDSFSDGGAFQDSVAAVAHARRLVSEGASIVDVGGESTRPGADPVRAGEELSRVIPVVEGIAGLGLPVQISVDTMKAAVAEAALDAGAPYVNDVTAFRHDPELAPLVADRGLDCCLMHMLGEPRTMQEDPRYDDVVSDVKAFLEERLAFAVGEGVPEERVWLDPGIGFGKTVAHNLLLLRHLRALVATGYPVLVGTSRKSFLGRLVARSADGSADGSPGAGVLAADDRLEGSLATAAWAFTEGAAMVRAHDVRPTVQLARLVSPESAVP